MNFQESLIFIYNNKKDDSEIINPFYLYCRLSDLCNKSFEDIDKVKTYWKVTSQINIPAVLLSEGIDKGLLTLKVLFFQIKGIPFNKYKECVYYTVKALDKNYKFKIKNKQINKNHIQKKLINKEQKIEKIQNEKFKRIINFFKINKLLHK